MGSWSSKRSLSLVWSSLVSRQFSSSYLYSSVERGTTRERPLAQEHNTEIVDLGSLTHIFPGSNALIIKLIITLGLMHAFDNNIPLESIY